MQRLKNLFYTGLLISCLYTVIGYLGLVNQGNISLYDAISLRFYQPVQSQSAVVEFEKSQAEADFLTYLTHIKQAQPQSLLLILPDENAVLPWVNFAQAHNLPVAKRLGLVFDSSGIASVIEESTWQPTLGYVTPANKQRGINRTVPLFASSQEQEFTSFLSEYSVQNNSLQTPKSQDASFTPQQEEPTSTTNEQASKQLIPESITNAKNGLIDFVDVPKSIPIVAIEKVQSDVLANGLLQNRHVLITLKEAHLYSSITTPFYVDGLTISEMQYQAIALEALNNNAFITPMPFWLGLIFLMFISCVGLLLLTSNELKWSKFLILSMLIVGMPATYWVFAQLSVIPPLIEVFLSVFIAANMFFYVKRKEDNNILRQINNEVQSRLKGTILPKSFTEGADPWGKIAVLVQQQLKLHRSIFLEKVPNDHRVREINAINCSIDDIHEMRRDFLREPYKAAISARNLTETNRPYFKNRAEGETEFLIPFLVGVDVLGFWALTVIIDGNFNQKRFNVNVENMANQISQLLLYKQRWQSREERTLWRRLRAWFYSENQYLTALHNVELLTRKVDFIHRMFATMNNATIIYDLFGQVVEINHAMEALAEKLHLSVFNLSALSLLHEITGQDEDLLRGRLRAIVLHHTKEQLVTTVELGDESFVVSVRPIISTENTQDSDAPFKVLGLLCEFFDAAEVRDIQNIERSLYGQFSARIKNHLSAIQMASLQLERHFGNSEGQLVSHMIQQELQDAAHVTRNTQKLMRKMSERTESRLLPFDAFNLVKTRVELFQSQSNDPIDINMHFPTFVSLGYGNLELIVSAIDAVLAVLAEDAIAPKKLKVTGRSLLRQDKHWLYIRLSSEGYGLPQNYIKNLQAEKVEQGDDTSISKLAKLTHELKEWGMGAKIKSQLGKGLSVILALEGVNIER